MSGGNGPQAPNEPPLPFDLATHEGRIAGIHWMLKQFPEKFREELAQARLLDPCPVILVRLAASGFGADGFDHCTRKEFLECLDAGGQGQDFCRRVREEKHRPSSVFVALSHRGQLSGMRIDVRPDPPGV